MVGHFNNKSERENLTYMADSTIQDQNVTHASPSGDLQAEIVAALQDAIRSLGLSTEGIEMTLRPIPLEGACH